MKFIVSISLRNLFRQKRRNIMLGSAIALGVMILITANSFSHGISDIMFNKIVVYVAGHVHVGVSEGRGRQKMVFRDKERLSAIIKEQAGDTLVDWDEGIGIFLRALGNGKAENMVLVGVESTKQLSADQAKDLNESFHVIDGSFDDLAKAKVENPLILSKEKAEALNVKKGDTVRVRFRNLYGQDQSARLTVVGILSNDNVFMNGVMFVELKNIKELMGYKPWECGSIQLTLKDPQKNAALVADKIHDALKAEQAFLRADAVYGKKRAAVPVIPFMGNDDAHKKIIAQTFTLVAGKMDDVTGKEGVMISSGLAVKLGASVGKKIEFRFASKYGEKEASFTAEVKGIYRATAATGPDTVFMQESVFYPKYYENLPDQKKYAGKVFYPDTSAPFYSALGKEFIVLDRTRTTEDMQKKQREISKKKVRAATIDVSSMYESASAVLNLEWALNLITLVAVLVLFFIILIGVINTLRMTIRERTREIGTMRAIGMQKNDVRRIFILETGFLTLFAAIAGAILAFIFMGLISLIPFNLGDNPLGMLFVNKHLHFVPTLFGVFGSIALILAISVLTAFFPARKAAQMSAADALRHFE